MRTLILVSILSAAGCMTSDSEPEQHTTGSCTNTGAPQPACIEYSNASTEALEQDAAPMCHPGVWRFETCDRAMVIGGCTTMVNGPHGSFTVTNWFYAGGSLVTPDDVMARCSAIGQTFVAP
jgi:hypothetical protein